MEENKTETHNQNNMLFEKGISELTQEKILFTESMYARLSLIQNGSFHKLSTNTLPVRFINIESNF